ncbi:MAG TPA: cache domain-containing protein, partial [Aggregatilineales bacterium]|nr:cache domain-containing protein [Aggregatilineales bacterium]
MRWFQSRLLLLILLALLIVSVIPLTFMGTIGLDRYEELAQKTIDLNASQLNENSLDAMESQAANTANQLAIFLRQRDTDLRMLSNLPRIPEAYLEFAQSRQGEIWTLTPDTKTEIRFNLPLYREVAFINLAGQEELKIETECQSYPADCSVMVSSNVINVSNPADTTFGTEEYFIKAQQLRAGEIYAGRPIGYYIPSVVSFKGAQLLSGQRYEGIIRYITPVYENEAKIGYVTLALDHTHILEFIHHTDPTADRPLPAINPGSNNFVYIISSDGSAIAHVEHSNIAGVDRFGNPVPPFNETQPNGPGNFYEMGFLNPVFPE